MKSLESFAKSLNKHRAMVNSKRRSTDSCIENIAYYTPHINVLIYNAGRVFYDSDEGHFWGTYDALRMVLSAEEMIGRRINSTRKCVYNAGLTRAAGGAFFAQGYLTSDLMYFFLSEFPMAPYIS